MTNTRIIKMPFSLSSSLCKKSKIMLAPSRSVSIKKRTASIVGATAFLFATSFPSQSCLGVQLKKALFDLAAHDALHVSRSSDSGVVQDISEAVLCPRGLHQMERKTMSEASNASEADPVDAEIESSEPDTRPGTPSPVCSLGGVPAKPPTDNKKMVYCNHCALVLKKPDPYVKPGESYYHCPNPECDYDLCADCSEKPAVTRIGGTHEAAAAVREVEQFVTDVSEDFQKGVHDIARNFASLQLGMSNLLGVDDSRAVSLFANPQPESVEEVMPLAGGAGGG
ncbi:unnamed protein product [Amoebophrya sp. A25]|nr:unnamed protein product [Amoebophrya sp. A25]|eukprot:GSA25T00016052001.1